jgi:hypothetical protein
MVNDLSSCIKNCEMSQFADDGAIWKSGPMIAYYHIYLEIPFFAVNHVSITYQMLFESL